MTRPRPRETNAAAAGDAGVERGGEGAEVGAGDAGVRETEQGAGSVAKMLLLSANRHEDRALFVNFGCQQSGFLRSTEKKMVVIHALFGAIMPADGTVRTSSSIVA